MDTRPTDAIALMVTREVLAMLSQLLYADAAVTLNVLFGSNSDTIPSTSYAEIDKLGTILSWPQYTDYRIQLEGHTDSLGSQRKNQVLSEKRVQTIKDYLIQRFHIAPERIRAIGYGISRPIASNDTPEGRSQNRRVEV